jgi:hypothetical protein
MTKFYCPNKSIYYFFKINTLSIDNCFTIKYFIYIYDENKFTTI